MSEIIIITHFTEIVFKESHFSGTILVFLTLFFNNITDLIKICHIRSSVVFSLTAKDKKFNVYQAQIGSQNSSYANE